MVHKKRKTNVIESDDEDDVAMDTGTASTSQSIKTKIAEQFQSQVVAKQPGRKGKPSKTKKSQKSQDNSEADKIKELAEKLKKQMKEKQEKQKDEAQQSGVNKSGTNGRAKVSNESEQMSKSSLEHSQHNTNKIAKANSHKAKVKDNKVIAHRKENTTEISRNQKTVGPKTGSDSTAVKMTTNENAARCSTEGAAEKSSSKPSSSTDLDSLLNLQSKLLKPSGSLSSQGKYYCERKMQFSKFCKNDNLQMKKYYLDGKI